MFPPVSSESSPRPANAVAPTNFTATTISHHYNAITTITTGAVIAVTAITTITTITIIAITTTITTTTPLLPLILDSVVATASPPPLLDLNLRRLHAQPSLVDDFSQGRILKPELDIASLLTPVWQPTKGAPPSTYDCRRGPSTPNSCDRRAVTPLSQYCLFCDASSRPSRVSSYWFDLVLNWRAIRYSGKTAAADADPQSDPSSTAVAHLALRRDHARIHCRVGLLI
ncbi:hypothetical protein E4U49_008059 [Claviceps purpurea]|nr:hypothetical protein E4U49_008059 [Claviceps purpurea]